MCCEIGGTSQAWDKLKKIHLHDFEAIGNDWTSILLSVWLKENFLSA